MDTESHPRPRRSRHDSSKFYDMERKDLELTEVLDVLQRYVDYGGGINCCVCGKLYKSRVCFIKHLWEHTVYWEQFAGHKNQMRVLSIQAALILYASARGRPLSPFPVETLLVTSPHCTENVPDAKPEMNTAADIKAVIKETKPVVAEMKAATYSATESKQFITQSPADLPFPALNTARMSGRSAEKSICCGGYHYQEPGVEISAPDALRLLPTTPVKHRPSQPQIPRTPRKKAVGSLSALLKRKAPPPPLELATPEKRLSPLDLQSPTQHGEISPSAPLRSQEFVFRTPEKRNVVTAVPGAPKKSRKFAESDPLRNRRVRRCLLPTTDVPGQRWKETACKRKRSE